uniref:Uncharacterized protein n=1 Tax=Timema poppense TaxID=170557 RepID=A0A7R9CXK4_TIMPO|nr:unnamed protein product [Timema poppensis]
MVLLKVVVSQQFREEEGLIQVQVCKKQLEEDLLSDRHDSQWRTLSRSGALLSSLAHYTQCVQMTSCAMNRVQEAAANLVHTDLNVSDKLQKMFKARFPVYDSVKQIGRTQYLENLTYIYISLGGVPEFHRVVGTSSAILILPTKISTITGRRAVEAKCAEFLVPYLWDRAHRGLPVPPSPSYRGRLAAHGLIAPGASGCVDRPLTLVSDSRPCGSAVYEPLVLGFGLVESKSGRREALSQYLNDLNQSLDHVIEINTYMAKLSLHLSEELKQEFPSAPAMQGYFYARSLQGCLYSATAHGKSEMRSYRVPHGKVVRLLYTAGVSL